MSHEHGVSNRMLKAVSDILGIRFSTTMKEGSDLFGNSNTYYSTTISTRDGKRLSVALPDGRRFSNVARKSWRTSEKELADMLATPGVTIFQPFTLEPTDMWVLPGFSSAREFRMKAQIHGGNFITKTTRRPSLPR